MAENKRDQAKVDPVTGGEERQPSQPLETVPEGEKANATTAEIPGTGEVVQDTEGNEARRVVRT